MSQYENINPKENNNPPNNINNNDSTKLNQTNTNNINTINNNKSPSSRSNSNKHSSESSYKSPFSDESKSKSKSKKSNSNSRSRSSSPHSSYSYSYSRDEREQSGIPQIFVTKLSSRVSKRDLYREFGRFGQIRDLKLKKGYAFIEYYDRENAKYAIRGLNDRKLFGQQQRIVVEEAKDYKRERERKRKRERRRSRSRSRNHSRSRSREYYSKRLPKKSDICFYCGKEGHWAYECELKKRDR